MDFDKFPNTFIASLPEEFEAYVESERGQERPEDSAWREAQQAIIESARLPVEYLNEVVALNWPGRNVDELREMAPRMQEMASGRPFWVDAFHADLPLMPYTSKSGEGILCALRIESNLAISLDNFKRPKRIVDVAVRNAYLLISMTDGSGKRKKYPLASYHRIEDEQYEEDGERVQRVPGFDFVLEPGSPDAWHGDPVYTGSPAHVALETILKEAILCSPGDGARR